MISWINNAKTGLFCEGSFAEQNKPALALLIHDIPQQIHCWILFNNDKTNYYILLSDFQIRQNEVWVSQINNVFVERLHNV